MTSVLWHFTWIVLILLSLQCRVECGCVQIMLNMLRYHPLVWTMILSNALIYLMCYQFQRITFDYAAFPVRKRIIKPGSCGSCFVYSGLSCITFGSLVAIIFTYVSNLFMQSMYINYRKVNPRQAYSAVMDVLGYHPYLQPCCVLTNETFHHCSTYTVYLCLIDELSYVLF